MDWVGALFLIVMGAGVLAVARLGYLSGEVRAGPFSRPRRDEEPLAFHLFLGLYFFGGFAMTVWGLLILVGMAPPLPIRLR